MCALALAIWCNRLFGCLIDIVIELFTSRDSLVNLVGDCY